jgi:hypothetical protein
LARKFTFAGVTIPAAMLERSSDTGILLQSSVPAFALATAKTTVATHNDTRTFRMIESPNRAKLYHLPQKKNRARCGEPGSGNSSESVLRGAQIG